MAKAEVEYFKSAEQRRRVVSEVLEKILVGESYRDIEKYLSDKYDLPDTYSFNGLFFSAKNQAAKITAQQADLIIPSHIMIYEQIYKYFEGVGYTAGKMKALKLKEKLLGLHKVDHTIEINNKRTTIIERDAVYDISKLEKNEQSRLDYLLGKAKK